MILSLAPVLPQNPKRTRDACATVPGATPAAAAIFSRAAAAFRFKVGFKGACHER